MLKYLEENNKKLKEVHVPLQKHYNTCKNGCAYCYANYSSKSVETNAAKYDPLSPLLCGKVQEDDKITIRKVESLKETQLFIGE